MELCLISVQSMAECLLALVLGGRELHAQGERASDQHQLSVSDQARSITARNAFVDCRRLSYCSVGLLFPTHVCALHFKVYLCIFPRKGQNLHFSYSSCSMLKHIGKHTNHPYILETIQSRVKMHQARRSMIKHNSNSENYTVFETKIQYLLHQFTRNYYRIEQETLREAETV